MGELTQLTFDYGDLAADDADALEGHADTVGQIQGQVRRVAAEGVIAIGKELKAAHDRLAGKGRDGMFRPWVKERCGCGVTSAYKAMIAFDVFGKCSYCEHFDASALYLLSSDSCPEAATNEAVRLAKKGEHISHKRAKQLKVKHSPGDNDDDSGFDGVIEVEKLFHWGRRLISKWPEENRQALAQVLNQLAEEAVV
jgi:hypothetical protein